MADPSEVRALCVIPGRGVERSLVRYHLLPPPNPPASRVRQAQEADLCFPQILPAGSPSHCPPALGEPKPLTSEEKPPAVTKIGSFIHVILLDFKGKNTVLF